MSKVHDLFSTNLYSGFLVGIEFELENVTTMNTDKWPVSFEIVEDSSLRNNGQELITPPVSEELAIKAHSSLFNGAVQYNGPPTSDRCSTHVHVNFTDVDEAKVKQFIRLYALVEPLFFQVVDDSRKNNIYCVPLAATNMLQTLEANHLGTVCEKWHKYCALNVKRLLDLGTIEFRHFEATSNTAKFSRWLRMIRNLYDFNLSTDVDILISDSVLYRLVATVNEAVVSRDTIYKLLENTLINDLLVTTSPTKTLINLRLKSKEPA